MRYGRNLAKESDSAIEKPIGSYVEPPIDFLKSLPPVAFTLKCLACFGHCDVLFEGSSYCQTCLKEKLRTGR